ncbi:MAG TPA: acetamidase, partial [Candidatus Angelobacter sp.]
GNDLKGTIVGNVLHFVATDNRGNTTEVDARFVGDKVTGHMSTTFSNAPKEHMKHSFSGYALKERPAGPARTIEFKPAEFHSRFSADITPIETIWPGDTIHTQTIDSGGVDEHGLTRALYGNPQTGPFYVGEAERGDVLAVHIKHLRLNRDYADSLDAWGGPQG